MFTAVLLRPTVAFLISYSSDLGLSSCAETCKGMLFPFPFYLFLLKTALKCLSCGSAAVASACAVVHMLVVGSFVTLAGC